MKTVASKDSYLSMDRGQQVSHSEVNLSEESSAHNWWSASDRIHPGFKTQGPGRRQQ